MMIPQTRQRLEAAFTDLQTYLVSRAQPLPCHRMRSLAQVAWPGEDETSRERAGW